MNDHLRHNAFLAGEVYSIADIACFPYIHFSRPFFASELSSLSELERWSQSVLARPAVKDALEGAEMNP